LLKPELIGDYCRSASETEKRRLYDVFASGERERIQKLVDEIYDALMTETHQKTEPLFHRKARDGDLWHTAMFRTSSFQKRLIRTVHCAPYVWRKL